MQTLDVSSKNNIVVIGGAGGIGSAIVQRFVKAGDFVIVGDINEQAGNELASRFGPSVCNVNLDVTKEASIQNFVEYLRDRNLSVTHLIESAGIPLPGESDGIKGVPFATVSESIDLNLKAHIRITQALLPLFRSDSAGNRSITYLSSINAILDYGGPAYSAAKAGLLGFVRACTSELGKDGIRVNAVLPGTVPTPNTTVDRSDMELMLEKTALGRLATPDEIAEVVYSLASSLTCITGQFVVADCGQSVKL